MKKMQNSLNRLAANFKPRKSPKTVYVQPQRIDGKDTYQQPRKTNN